MFAWFSKNAHRKDPTNISCQSLFFVLLSGSVCVVGRLTHLPPVFLQNFAKEFSFSDLKELDEDNIRTELKKAGGANYDAQTE